MRPRGRSMRDVFERLEQLEETMEVNKVFMFKFIHLFVFILLYF